MGTPGTVTLHQRANVASIMRRRADLAVKLEDLFESPIVRTIHPNADFLPIDAPVAPGWD